MSVKLLFLVISCSLVSDSAVSDQVFTGTDFSFLISPNCRTDAPCSIQCHKYENSVSSIEFLLKNRFPVYARKLALDAELIAHKRRPEPESNREKWWWWKIKSRLEFRLNEAETALNDIDDQLDEEFDGLVESRESFLDCIAETK